MHSSFYLELMKVREPHTKLSQTFMRWREKFLVYGGYCANLSRATNLLQELCDTDESFNAAVVVILRKHPSEVFTFKLQAYEKEDNNGRFKLRDVLSVPMQRILKYHLLLEKLIENTDPVIFLNFFGDDN